MFKPIDNFRACGVKNKILITLMFWVRIYILLKACHYSTQYLTLEAVLPHHHTTIELGLNVQGASMLILKPSDFSDEVGIWESIIDLLEILGLVFMEVMLMLVIGNIIGNPFQK